MGYLPVLIDRSVPTPGLDWAIMIAPCVSGTISFLCSSLMVLRFVRHRQLTSQKVKERLLLGLSIADMLFSTACAMSTFAGPSYLQDFIDASWGRIQVVKGNEATCRMQGWLYQTGVACQMYTACLSVYYYLAICHRKRDRDLIRCRLEPTMHVVIWIWALGTASLGVGMDLVVYVGTGGCRVSSNAHFTTRCEWDPTFPECQTRTIDWGPWLLFIFTLPSLALSILVILVMMTLIYRQVRVVEKRGNRWNFGSALVNLTRRKPIPTEATRMSTCGPSGFMANNTPSGFLSNQASGFMAENAEPKPEIGGALPQNVEEAYAPSVVSGVSADTQENINIVEGGEQSHLAKQTANGYASSSGASIDSVARLPRRSTGFASSVASSVAWSNDSAAMENPEDRKKRRERRKTENKLSNRVKETGMQYIVGFFVCYSITIINVSNSEPDPLLMLLFGGITFPAQGIWNFAFYTKDRMQGLRKKNPDQPWREAMVEAVFGFD